MTLDPTSAGIGAVAVAAIAGVVTIARIALRKPPHPSTSHSPASLLNGRDSLTTRIEALERELKDYKTWKHKDIAAVVSQVNVMWWAGNFDKGNKKGPVED